MIRVAVTLDKYGMGSEVIRLAEVEIVNDGTGTRETGNYEVRCIRPEEPLRGGKVKNHDRLNEPVLTLLRKALVAAGF